MLSRCCNMDCMEAMRQMPDKCFDLAVVDPPYYENAKGIIVPGGKISTTGVERRKYEMPHWEPPEAEYFAELRRISREQIIFGINCFQIKNPGRGRFKRIALQWGGGKILPVLRPPPHRGSLGGAGEEDKRWND